MWGSLSGVGFGAGQQETYKNIQEPGRRRGVGKDCTTLAHSAGELHYKNDRPGISLFTSAAITAAFGVKQAEIFPLNGENSSTANDHSIYIHYYTDFHRSSSRTIYKNVYGNAILSHKACMAKKQNKLTHKLTTFAVLACGYAVVFIRIPPSIQPYTYGSFLM